MAQTISLKIYLASTITFVFYWFIIKGALNAGGTLTVVGKWGIVVIMRFSLIYPLLCLTCFSVILTIIA